MSHNKVVNLNETFSIKTFNVLAQIFAPGYWHANKYYKRDKLPEFMEWNNRKSTLVKIILNDNPDVICLQEVQEEHQIFFENELSKHGYKVVKQKKKLFLNATFYKENKFKLDWKSDRSRIIISDLVNIKTGFHTFISNVHLDGDPYGCWKRFNQIRSMFKYILKRKNHLKLKGNEYSMFVVGDFNEHEDEGIYKLLSTGEISKEEESWGKKYCKKDFVLPTGVKKPFKSGYCEYFKREPKWTYNNEGHTGVLDFCFYWDEKDVLKLKEVVEMENEKKKKIMLPCKSIPSDHLPLHCKFVIEKEIE